VFDHWPELKVLNLSGLRVDFLPPSVFRLDHLKRLNVEGNQIPPESLAPLQEAGVRIEW